MIFKRHKQPRMHWKLRRALKQMRLHVFHEHPGDIDISKVTPAGAPMQIRQQYWIEMKPGVKVTKWHRLARLKLIAKLKEYLVEVADAVVKYHERFPSLMDNQAHYMNEKPN